MYWWKLFSFYANSVKILFIFGVRYYGRFNSKKIKRQKKVIKEIIVM